MRFGAAGLVLAAAIASWAISAANSAPPVHWSPDAINVTVELGASETVVVSLNAVEDLGNISLRLAPELKSVASISPSNFSNVAAGNTITVTVNVAVPTSAAPGLFDGTLQVRGQPNKKGKTRVLARPLPVNILIQEPQLRGVDADQNGVWDYIDTYIKSQYEGNAPLITALRQYAKAFQGGLLNAEDRDASLGYAYDLDRAIECVFYLRSDDAYDVLEDAKAVILNNKTRTETWLVFSDQSAGQVFPSTPYSERASSCVAE